ncbi:MAG: Cys-tRNA(Pro) deacylase [Eubacterium sp.]
MSKKSNEKRTNVMRILDSKKIKYTVHSYADTDAVSATEVADALGENPNQVFKTLVTVAKANSNYYVFVVPAEKELNLKKAAKAVGEKSIEMIKQKDLLPLTGYIHGGCSPIGMKKLFTTTIDETARDFETVIFSAGAIGYQIEISLDELNKVINFELSDIAD